MPSTQHLNRSAAVASNIRAEIARRRLSQRLLAEHLGVSQAAFSARMSGKTPLDVNELCSIADLLGIDPADLLRSASTPAAAEPPTVAAGALPAPPFRG